MTERRLYPSDYRERSRMIGFQVVGAEWPDFVIRDTVTGSRVGPVCETPEDAEYWMDFDLAELGHSTRHPVRR